MRIILLALAATLLGAGVFLFTQADDLSPGPGYLPDPVPPEGATESAGTASTETADEQLDVAAPELRAPDVVKEDPVAAPVREAIPRTPTRSFRGAALIQEKDQLIRGARTGSIDLDMLYRGVRERMSISVSNGQFAADVPRAVRLELVGGVFENKPVHFERPVGQFDPTDSDYALIGVVTPAVTLEVVDGAQGTPLQDVTVARADGATSASLGEPTAETVSVSTESAALVSGAASPITLPYVRATGPIWFAVSAPGYAPTNVLVDPRESSNTRVRLYPSADLTVRVTGPARGALRTLVLVRDEGEGRTPHTATFTASHPGVEATPDALVFPIRGLAGITHTVRAKGLGENAVTRDLGSILRVDLNAGDERTVELRIE